MQRELELDEKALSNLQTDRKRFLCKAVENYIQCLEQGEEHDTWVFRLASLWLENADIKDVNETMKVSKTSFRPGSYKYLTKQTFSASYFPTCFALQKGVKRIPSYKFLPLMYQLAARMGTKMAAGVAEDPGFHNVLNDVTLLFYLFM